jgi:hypothetical protein
LEKEIEERMNQGIDKGMLWAKLFEELRLCSIQVTSIEMFVLV